MVYKKQTKTIKTSPYRFCSDPRLLEANGVVRHDSAPFKSNNKYGNGVQVAFRNKYSFSKNPKELWNGTSYFAPVISALASMILQRNKNQFARGYDSIITKSALISGSKKPNYTNRVYTEETGFGIPQFLDVDQAVKNLYYFAQLRKASNVWSKHKVYFKKGWKVRANITWLAHNVKSNGFADIDLYVYDPNGNQVAYSNGVDKNTETVEFNVETSGEYTFHVKRYSEDEKTIEN